MIIKDKDLEILINHWEKKCKNLPPSSKDVSSVDYFKSLQMLNNLKMEKAIRDFVKK